MPIASEFTHQLRGQRQGAGSDTCDFCHFDQTSTNEVCHDMPNWKKSEIGSMDCSRNVVAEEGSCFTKSQLKCGTVKRALQGATAAPSSLLSENLMVLQVDVEGFEQQVLEKFLKFATASRHSP